MRILLKSLVFTSLFACLINLAHAGNPAPGFELPTIDAKTVKLSDLKGQVVYVDFWATWCPPCRKSFPWMESMYQKYNKLGFTIVAINLDGKREVMEDFIKSMPSSFIIAHDAKGGVADAYQLKAMPSSYLIDRNGNLIRSHAGFREKDKAALEAEIKQLLTM